ncbi:MAG TPA: PGPGW domain-containing protein [Planctomycetaceae bacterium]|nr:PGPGW domain-containing protein [Planctomycetaceae bacterium]
MDVKTTEKHPTQTPTGSASAPAIKTWLAPGAALIFWQHARKVVVLVVGTTIILIGVALLILPGPGWLIIFGGLALLATEFAWARWMLKHARVRFEQLKQAAISTWNHGPAATAPPRSDD